MALRDVIALFKINVQGLNDLEDTDKRLNKIRREAEKTERSLIRFGKAFIVGVVARGIKKFVQGQIQLADELKHNAENLGLTTDELQKYQYVASVMQVPTQQAVVAFRFFNRAIGEVAMGTKSTTKYFQQMGVKIYDANGKIKPTDQLLLEFSDKLASIPDQSLRTAYAMRALGRGGASMLPVLQKGSGALKQMFQDIEELGGGFDEDFIEKAHEVDVEGKRLAMGWRTMSAILIKALIPYLKMWIDHGIKNVKMLIETAKHSYAVASAIRFLEGVAVATAAAVSLAWAPEIALFTALAATVFAAYLIFDDFYTFLKGGKSVIGDNIDKMGGDSKNVAKEIKDAFNSVKDAVMPVADSFKELNHTFSGAGVAAIIKWSGVFTTGVVVVLDQAITKAEELIEILQFALPGTGGESFQQMMDNIHQMESQADKRNAAYNRAADALMNIDGSGPRAQRGTSPAPVPNGAVTPGGWQLDTLPAGAVDQRGAPPPGFHRVGWQLDKGPSGDTGLPSPPLPPPNITVNVHAPSSDPAAVGRAAGRGAAAGMRNAYAGVTAGMPSAVGSN